MEHEFDTPTLEQILHFETKVWEALQRGDASADRALLAPDFVGVYPSGFAGRTEHAEQLQQGPSVERFNLSEARLMVLSPELALLSYRARYLGLGSGDEREMYVSSLWRREGEGWINLFSQDTPAE